MSGASAPELALRYQIWSAHWRCLGGDALRFAIVLVVDGPRLPAQSPASQPIPCINDLLPCNRCSV